MNKERKFTLRHYENIHIPLWLLKDTCWMMEWRILGMIMIVPTVSVALYLTYRSWQTRDFYINLAISFWISANAYWMCCEFFKHEELKYYAGFPFVLGMLSTIAFYLSKKPRTI
jgi:hypothetical protein